MDPLETALTDLITGAAPTLPEEADAILQALREHPALAHGLLERHRQIHKHGWTAEQDDQEPAGNLLRAACAMLEHARLMMSQGTGAIYVPPIQWPWSPMSWRPPITPQDAFIKAIALVAAEFDRMRREAQHEQSVAQGLTPDI